MDSYVIKIVFDDRDLPVFVDLPGVALQQAEDFTAQLRYDVAQARSVSAPVVEEMQASIPGIDLVLDPARVISIDLEEADPDDLRQAPTDPDGGPVELDGPLT